MRRLWGIVAVVVLAGVGFAPGARAASQTRVADTTVTTTRDPYGNYTSVFNGRATGTDGKDDAFRATLHASPCCTVHSFVLGPWSGTWSLNDGAGDSVYGTASGPGNGSCVPPASLDGFCDGAQMIGPGWNLELAITGGTGKWAGRFGSGTLNGDMTGQDVGTSTILIALFVGTLTV